MTNSRNEKVSLSTADKIGLGIGFAGLIGSMIGCTAVIVGIFYSTTGALERKNDVQDIRLDGHDGEIARLRGLNK